MPPPSFRPIDQDRSKDTAKTCANLGCNALPASGQRFKICSGCKDTAYCSAAHQKEHWKSHKTMCNHDQRDQKITAIKDSARELWPWAFSPEWPPLQDRIHLLRDFNSAHGRNIQRSLACDMFLRGGCETFDFKSHFLQINLRYRSDCGGNPGIAFRVDSATTRLLSEIRPESGLGLALESGRITRENTDAYRKTHDPSYVGLYLVLLQMDDYGLWTTRPINRIPSFDEGLRYENTDLWFTEMQFNVENGFVYERIKPGDFLFRIGRIKLVGRKWKFVELTPQELQPLGLDADYPGFLY